MRKTSLSALTLGVCLAAPSAAQAWEPVPAEPSKYTTVTRILDVGRAQNGFGIAVAESPAQACAAIRGSRALPASTFNDLWLGIYPTQGDRPEMSQYFAVALAARAQNLQVRVTIANWNNACVIVELSTCADAAACALPAAP